MKTTCGCDALLVSDGSGYRCARCGEPSVAEATAYPQGIAMLKPGGVFYEDPAYHGPPICLDLSSWHLAAEPGPVAQATLVDTWPGDGEVRAAFDRGSADPEPKAEAKADPYEAPSEWQAWKAWCERQADPNVARRIVRLDLSSGYLRPEPSETLSEATARARTDAAELRRLIQAREFELPKLRARLARTEAALRECGDPDAIAEHGRKAGGS